MEAYSHFSEKNGPNVMNITTQMLNLTNRYVLQMPYYSVALNIFKTIVHIYSCVRSKMKSSFAAKLFSKRCWQALLEYDTDPARGRTQGKRIGTAFNTFCHIPQSKSLNLFYTGTVWFLMTAHTIKRILYCKRPLTYV